MKYHPDRNKDSEEQKAEAEKKFKKVTEAYDVLKDEAKRKRYDMGGYENFQNYQGFGQGGNFEFDINDFFTGMGGGPGGRNGF